MAFVQRRLILFSLALPLMMILSAVAQDAPAPKIIKCSAPKALQHFASLDKKVVTFLGYTSNYEDPAAMLKTAEEVLSKLDPQEYVVNIGATPMGIGQIYALAKKMGFKTYGVVSELGEQYRDSIKDVDVVFFIKDKTWGGYNEKGVLNPTSEVMIAPSDIVISIGGGQVAHDELVEALKRGKYVKIYPAEMKHADVIAKFQKNNEKTGQKTNPQPADFYGKANDAELVRMVDYMNDIRGMMAPNLCPLTEGQICRGMPPLNENLAYQITLLFAGMELSAKQSEEIIKIVEKIEEQREIYLNQHRSADFVASYLKFMIAQLVAAVVTGEAHFSDIDTTFSKENFMRFSAFALAAPAVQKGLGHLITPFRPERGIRAYRQILSPRGLLHEGASLALTMELVDLIMDSAQAEGDNFEEKALNVINKHLSLEHGAQVGVAAASFAGLRPLAAEGADLAAKVLSPAEKKIYQAFPKLARMGNRLHRAYTCAKVSAATSLPGTIVLTEIIEESLLFTAAELNQKLLQPYLAKRSFKKLEESFWNYVQDENTNPFSEVISTIATAATNQQEVFDEKAQQIIQQSTNEEQANKQAADDLTQRQLSYLEHADPAKLNTITGAQAIEIVDTKKKESLRMKTVREVILKRRMELQQEKQLKEHRQTLQEYKAKADDPRLQKKIEKLKKYLQSTPKTLAELQAQYELSQGLHAAAWHNHINHYRDPSLSPEQNEKAKQALHKLVDATYTTETLPAIKELQQPLPEITNDQTRLIREGLLAYAYANNEHLKTERAVQNLQELVDQTKLKSSSL